MKGRQLLRGQWVRLPRGGRSHDMVQPVLLPIRRPLVAVCGHRADDARLVREVQTAELTVFLHGIVPLFSKTVRRW
jgi:hypothetical protein